MHVLRVSEKDAFTSFKGVLAIPDIGNTGRFLVWTISPLILGTKRSRIAFLSNTFKRLAFIVPNHMESMVNDHTT